MALENPRLPLKNPIKLAEDPKKSGDSTLQSVFLDDVARTFWLGLKYIARGHTHEGFTESCLEASASIIEHNSLPKTPEDLRNIIYINIAPDYATKEIAEALFPYISEKQTLDYIITKPTTRRTQL